MRRTLTLGLVLTGLLVSSAEAHTLYAGPARGTAASFVRQLAATINADRSTSLYATSAGATACYAENQHARSCGVYIYMRDAAAEEQGSGRCDFQLRVAFTGDYTYARSVTHYTEPACVQALRVLG